jgi:hypothetical protein
MAGRPRTRARREAAERAAAEGDARRRTRVPAAAIQRTREVGAAQAGREFGVKASSLRSALSRGKDEPTPLAPDHLANGDRAAWLHQRADMARQAQQRAEDRADVMVNHGQAAEARNASVVASASGDRARALEDAARAQELHQARITEEQGHAIYATVEALLAALGLPFERSSRRVLAALLRRAAEGHAPSLDAVEPYVQQARDEVRERIRAELREPEPDAEPAPVEDTPALEPTPPEIELDEAPGAPVVPARPAGHRLPSGVTIYDPAPVVRTISPARTGSPSRQPSRWVLR